MKLLFILLLLFSSVITAAANVTLPDVISDAMVLQRDRAVPIWGKADPGESVTVKFGNQAKTAVAGADGKWIIRLGPMRSSATPQTMVVEGRNRIELKDILVGEVWLVSGQSNMQRLLSETANGEQATAGANHPLIRLFNVSRQVAFKHAPPPLGVWRACTPESVKEFSAAGYYFGVELEKELNVPIGLLNSSYGGSQAEAWTPVEYLLAFAGPEADRRSHENLG
jgi:sialate O-acetylesterase